ncbi:MAG: DUF1838 family protein [Gammaproteobacteria bacterium]
MRIAIPAILLAAALCDTAGAAPLDPKVPEDAVRIQQKMICSTEEGKVIIHWWEGEMYSRVPGEKDRHLFNIQGMNIRHCKNFADSKRGYGFQSFSREVMIHLDPSTGQIIDRWKNPWTGEELEVVHVANDPVNMRAPIYARDETGKPYTLQLKISGNTAMARSVYPLFYANPLAGDYQDWVGGAYHAVELFTNFYATGDLFDRQRDTVQQNPLAWSRISAFLPWMKMGSRVGEVYTSTIGGRVGSVDELAEPLRSILRERYPQYLAPPPLGDPRPNETSWTVFRKHLDAQPK